MSEIPVAVAVAVAAAAELARLRAENARLLKMLELSPRQAAPPGPAQADALTEALTEALMYVKAGRAFGVPAGLEVSRSGVGMHAWVFFTAPVPAETARRGWRGTRRRRLRRGGQRATGRYTG